MPRIPIYSARQSPQTDPGGLPTVRTSQAMASALKQLGQSIGGLKRPAKYADLLQRSREQQDKRQQFGRIRTNHDTLAFLEAELARRKEQIDGDAEGFYQAFVEEVMGPAVDAAMRAQPQDDQPEFRKEFLRQAEPLLETAALIECDQSLRFYMAETDRIADRIVGELGLETYDKVKSDLEELLDAAPIPNSTKNARRLELDRKLARQVYGLMLAEDPASLTGGAMGWSKRKGKSKSVDPRFQTLPASERRQMFEQALAIVEETGLLKRGTR